MTLTETLTPELQGYHETADAVMEYLLYEHRRPGMVDMWALSKRFPKRKPKDLNNAVRYVIAAWDERVLAYHDGNGTYRIIDIERYMDPPPPGVVERWRQRFVR